METLKWKHSFLCFRQQRRETGRAPVLPGVSQGTVLGPSLILLNLNDILANTEELQIVINFHANQASVYLDPHRNKGEIGTIKLV